MTDPDPQFTGLAFPIEFHRFSETLRNTDFKGPGTLEVSADGEHFRFTGAARGLSANETTLELGYHEIANVYRSGDRVSLQTPKGEAGRKRRPFIFYCQDEASAQQIIELLPAASSPDFREDAARISLLDKTCPPLAHPQSPTSIIIAVNLIIFVLMAAFANAGWFQPQSLEPYIRFGANNGAYTTSGQWYRLFTCMFLHYGLIHVLMNCWVLYGAGHLLERLVGRALFLAIYLGSGIIASLSSIFWHGDSTWSAGASGAVFSVYGALLAVSLRGKSSLPASIFTPLRNSAIAFIIYNFLFSAMHPGIDNAAHAGGLIAGFILGYISYVPINKSERKSQVRRSLPITSGLAAVIIGIGIAFAPRFDYQPQEARAYNEMSREFSEGEKAILSKVGPLLERSESTEAAAQVAIQEMNTTAVPFYEQWEERFAAASFTSDTPLERDRYRLEQYAATRAAAFEALTAYLDESPAPGELETYTKLVEESNAYLEALESGPSTF